MDAQKSLVGLVGGATGAALSLSNLGKLDSIEKGVNAEKAAKEKADLSYGNSLNAIMGEAMTKNPKLLDSKYMEKAISTMEAKKNLMMFQRESWRAYRNQFEEGSPEYNKIEAMGQARKQENLEEFRRDLDKIGKPGRPKGGR